MTAAFSTVDFSVMAVQLLKEIAEFVNSPSVLRKLLFATNNLPRDLPDYWKIVTSFATCGSHEDKLIQSKIQTLVDNMQYYDGDAFLSDKSLMDMLLSEQGRDGKPLGVVLVSPISKCQVCGGELAVKADRPSHLTLYSDTLGTVTAIHYRKLCKNTRKGACNTVQHYGYYSKNAAEIVYDGNWNELPYFISSRETAFETKILSQLDAEILIGTLSYKQRAEIYNYVHGYEHMTNEDAEGLEIVT